MVSPFSVSLILLRANCHKLFLTVKVRAVVWMIIALVCSICLFFCSFILLVIKFFLFENSSLFAWNQINNKKLESFNNTSVLLYANTKKMLQKGTRFDLYGSWRPSISLDSLVLLTELMMEIVHREEFLKLYIKTYLQKTFETLYYILTNNSNFA